MKCIACSPASYLFANSTIQTDPDGGSGRISIMTPIICQDFCVELVSACQQENATYTDPNENNEYVNVFPNDVRAQLLCGIVDPSPPQNYSQQQLTSDKKNAWEWILFINNAMDSTLSVWKKFFTSTVFSIHHMKKDFFESWSSESQQFSTLVVDDIPIGVSLNCNTNLYKLQHCYPGTSMIVDSAFMTSILVYVWVLGLVVSAVVAGLVFLCKWKTRSYQQIM